ncbi:MAG: hypothetical protein K2H56_01155, partial [Malacoplasma sp.]|nr:hypothetical protein [Malacoplasma sp.]
MEKDIVLLKKFSELKLPWWLLIVPIFNNITYLIIFKSWFVEFSDRRLIFDYYFQEKLKTFGISLLTLFLWIIFSSIYWIITLLDLNYLGDFSISFFIIISCFFVFFNLIFHPINLVLRPKKIIKGYEKYCSEVYLKKVDWSIKKNISINYQLHISLFHIKNNLFRMSYYSLFNPDLKFALEIKNLDIDANPYLSDFRREKMKRELPPFSIIPIERRFWYSNPVFSYFWYLFSTGFWFLGTLNLLYKLMNVKDKFIIKT